MFAYVQQAYKWDYNVMYMMYNLLLSSLLLQISQHLQWKEIAIPYQIDP